MPDPTTASSERYAGMTLNERLYTPGLLERFDEALQQSNRGAMAELLEQVGIDASGGQFTINTMLANPARYGRKG